MVRITGKPRLLSCIRVLHVPVGLHNAHIRERRSVEPGIRGGEARSPTRTGEEHDRNGGHGQKRKKMRTIHGKICPSPARVTFTPCAVLSARCTDSLFARSTIPIRPLLIYAGSTIAPIPSMKIRLPCTAPLTNRITPIRLVLAFDEVMTNDPSFPVVMPKRVMAAPVVQRTSSTARRPRSTLIKRMLTLPGLSST